MLEEKKSEKVSKEASKEGVPKEGASRGVPEEEKEILQSLEQFIGTTEYYKIGTWVIATEGIKYLCDRASVTGLWTLLIVYSLCWEGNTAPPS